MRQKLSLSVACLLAIVPSLSSAKTYNAFKQFTNKNPHGTWSYGYGITGSSFTEYASYETGNPCCNTWYSGNPPPYIPANKSATTYVGGTWLLPGLRMLMHPGPGTDSILRWIAPAAGTYKFSGFYQIEDEHPSGIAALIYDNAQNITSSAFGGGSGVITGPGANLSTLTPGGKESFSFTLTVTQGEIISFGLNNDGNYQYDTTGVKVVVTAEP